MARSQGACPGPGCGLRAGCGRGSRAQGGGGGSGTWRGVRDLCADEGLGGGVRHCAGLLRAPPTPVQTADQGRLWQVRSRASRLPAHGRPRTHRAPPWPLGQWEMGRGGREHCPRLGKGGEGGGGTVEAGGDLACDVCVQGMGGASGAGEGLPWAERGRAQCQLYRWFGLSLSRAKVRRGPGAADTPQQGSPESQVPLLASWAGPLNPWTPSCPSRSMGSQQGPPGDQSACPGHLVLPRPPLLSPSVSRVLDKRSGPPAPPKAGLFSASARPWGSGDLQGDSLHLC